MKALRDYPPQARHHFTQADQVDQLVRAALADPDTGFMARLMMLCSLPRTNPGNCKEYKRVNGPFTLIMFSSSASKLPFGNLPRLLLAWLCTEAVRTQSRELVLGSSLSGFMRRLDMVPIGGGSRGERTRLCNQMKRLFNAHIQLAYEDEQVSASVNPPVASRTGFWWNERKISERLGWESKIELSEDFFNAIIRHPVPLDMNTLKAMKTLFARAGSLPMARLPHLCAEAPAAAHLATVVLPVRCGPLQGRRPRHHSILPTQSPAGVEEDQGGLAGSKLCRPKGLPRTAAIKPLSSHLRIIVNSQARPPRVAPDGSASRGCL